MDQSSSTIPTTLLMALLGGATLGGFAFAFTALKTSQDLRNGLNGLIGRFNPKAGRPDSVEDETVRAAFI